jgi:hypothetical protein
MKENNADKQLLKQSDKDSPCCRICLCEEEDASNPLIAPCKCTGSMGLIHLSCLKTWFAGKRVMKITQMVTTYFWKHLECELCKQAYPYETKSRDGTKLLNIIDYDTPIAEPGYELQYMVLESISSNTSKVIHVINMTHTNKLYIGRGHEAQVRVTDISVSRLHAYLAKSTQGYYYLMDNDSKFGTLSQVKTPLLLKVGSNIHLQIGRTVFELNVKGSYKSALASCLCFNK